MIKVWRTKRYANDEPQFLLDFDIAYRMRRYRFVKSQLEMLSRLDSDALDRMHRTGVTPPEGVEQTRAFRDEITKLRGVFDGSYRKLRVASELAQQAPDILTKIADLNIKEEDLNMILGVQAVTGKDANWAPLPVVSNTDYERRAAQILTEDREKKLELLGTAIVNAYATAIRGARTDVEKAIQISPDDGPMRQNVLRLARALFLRISGVRRGDFSNHLRHGDRRTGASRCSARQS